MPAATFYQPIEEVLREKCEYEYYNQTTESYSADSKSRICHVTLQGESDRNKDIVLMIFTVRNQPSAARDTVWKIHSEGPKRNDPGAVVPLRNKALKIAAENSWKYIAVAVAPITTPSNDIISKYIISIESYFYGDDTVYDLTDDLEELEKLGEPDFHRKKIVNNGVEYSFSFIKKDRFLEYLRYFDNRPYSKSNEIKQLQKQDKPKETQTTKGANILLYGVPGSGKSHEIEEIVQGADYERVVFHPDYSYSDFVGQIMPRLEKGESEQEHKLTYGFVPGPFTKALKKAINNPEEMHYLIIEEINRGNAPAVFGDVFQLLDREPDGSGKFYITNYDIAEEIYGENKKEDKIAIPSNLTIIATMNTSDQNVFTLDTAFQRRWNMKYMPNRIASAEHANEFIDDREEITWSDFATFVNEIILNYNMEITSSEDKQLGAYFIRKDELNKEQFAEKVLKYLWDDVYRMDRTEFFSPDIRTIGDMVETYVNEENRPLRRIMKRTVYDQLMNMTANSPEEAIDESETFEGEIPKGDE